MLTMGDAARILAGNGWYQRQPEGLRAALLARARLTTVEQGQWIYGEGDATAGIYAVLAGSVRLLLSLGDHRDVLVDVAGPGQILGQTPQFGGGPRLVTAVAGTPTRLLVVADRDLDAIARNQPSIWLAVSELLYRQLAATLRLVGQVTGLPPRQRIAARILSLVAAQRDGERAVAINQSDLAELTGLSRQTVNRHLGALQEAGLIAASYACLTVVDPSGLRRIADGVMRPH